MNDPGDQPSIPRLATGVSNLDAILQGGLPTGAVTVLAGPPGSGKTILAQQICFHHAAQGGRILYFNTLTEPMAKTLLYLRPFAFFDPVLLQERMRLVDLGVMLRSKGLALTCELLMEHVRQFKPSMVVIDSFKVFDDLAQSVEELRKFTYEITVQLMAWECTSLLLGEYSTERFEHPAYSAIDGIVTLQQRELSGEQQRLLRVVKMRGTSHGRDPYAFTLGHTGLELYAPGITLRRTTVPPPRGPFARMKTGISKLDALLGEGIPLGSSIIVSGMPGSGKTVLGLEFLYRGAREHGQRGLYLSFEQTEERLRATARGMGWALDEEIDRGLVRFVFIPQPDIIVDRDLQKLRQQVAALGAQRVVLDSVSVFLHKIDDPRITRDKVFWLSDIVQEQQAVGLFVNDLLAGSQQLTRSGVEETVMDGLIFLSRQELGLERHRYIEVNKLRNTAHATGRHPMTIGPGGLDIFPRIDDSPPLTPDAPSASPRPRLSSGVPQLDALLGGGLLEGSVTLISGSPGTGKSTLCLQFALDAAHHQERALYITLEQDPVRFTQDAQGMDLPLRQALDAGWVRLLHLPRERPHASRLLSLVADTIRDWKPTRLVLDSASGIEGSDPASEESRELLHGLVLRLRGLGVTSLLTLETRALLSSDPLGEEGLSPPCDNLLLLRYVQQRAELVPTLTVVKSRGSAHDRASHRLSLGRGGVTLTGRIQPEPPASMQKTSAQKRRFFTWRRHD